MHGPDGSDHANESVFLEVEAPSRIVIQHLSPPHFILTVTLAAHEGGTQINWVGEFEDPAVAARIRHIVEPANEQNLDRLESVLSGMTRAEIGGVSPFFIVQSVPAALAFYRDRLGFEITFSGDRLMTIFSSALCSVVEP